MLPFDRATPGVGESADLEQVYERLRRKLVTYFRYKRSVDPYDLADETITRVVAATKRQEIRDIPKFALGVAHNVQVDNLRKAKKESSPPFPDAPAASPSQEAQCLEQCLRLLSQENRELVEAYFVDRDRKELARTMGLAPNALRIRIFKLKRTLVLCKERCTRNGTAE